MEFCRPWRWCRRYRTTYLSQVNFHDQNVVGLEAQVYAATPNPPRRLGVVPEAERFPHGLVPGPTNAVSVTRLRCMNSTCFLSLIDIMSMWLNVERQRQRSHAAYSDGERREYMVEACNKKIIQSRSKRSLSMFKSKSMHLNQHVSQVLMRK